ncbi:MAG: TonB-dependent receptor plug domain-containing protein [Parabacteroides sp.]
MSLPDKGQPGSENVINVRRVVRVPHSGTGSDPLILINGVEGDLASLDPNIIESVSVLKDAASLSVFVVRVLQTV